MLDPNFILDDAVRDRLITRFGAGADAWCAALPELVERYRLRWDLDLNQALSGNTSGELSMRSMTAARCGSSAGSRMSS